jgi:hypothetical protein
MVAESRLPQIIRVYSNPRNHLLIDEIVVWLKMAMELVDEQGFHVINGKLRRGTLKRWIHLTNRD